MSEIPADAAIARSLVPGGALLIDTIDPIALAVRFRLEHWQELEDARAHKTP